MSFWHDLARNGLSGGHLSPQISQWLLSKIDGRYLKPVFDDGELPPEAVVKDFNNCQ